MLCLWERLLSVSNLGCSQGYTRSHHAAGKSVFWDVLLYEVERLFNALNMSDLCARVCF